MSVTKDKMTALAKSFPSVTGLIDKGVLKGVEPWDIVDFLQSCEEMPFGLGQSVAMALSFIKWIWNPALAPDWDLHHAWAVWDDAHRLVWMEWAKHPWWA